MLRPFRYSKYERPDGYSKGDPIVYVRKNVISDLGMPKVDYDGLDELFHRDLGIPRNKQPKAKLYGGSIGKRALRGLAGDTVSVDALHGFHIAYTNTIHVNAPSAERRGAGLMKVFVHEAQHLADSRNYPLARAVELGMAVAAIKGGMEVAEATGFVPELIGALAAREGWYAVQPAERRARATENSEVYFNHVNDIVFPARRT